jgi:DNA-binding CsgD family transcriptional regulator
MRDADSRALRCEAIRAAADELVTAALLGDSWDGVLRRLAAAAGAREAVLMRNRNRRLVAAISTPDIAGLLVDVLEGRAPPSSRQVRVNHDCGSGFRVDHDDYTDAELADDPFYQDFLQPNGLFWHADARLDLEDGDELAISFRRAKGAGPYRRCDARVLDSVLPELKAAVRIARRVLDAEAAGMARLLHQRGDPVFELDAWGRVLRAHADGDGSAQPIRVLGRRLVASDGLAQSALELATLAAVRAPYSPGGVSLNGRDGERFYLQFVPVGGRARDVFGATSAVATLIERHRRQSCVGAAHAMFRDAFGLTEREIDVAVLLGQGLDLADVARRLRVGIGTARNHLKRVFDKTDTRRQAELVALIARLGV